MVTNHHQVLTVDNDVSATSVPFRRQSFNNFDVPTTSTWRLRSSYHRSVRPAARPSGSQHRRTSLHIVDTSSQDRGFRTSWLAAAPLSATSTRSTDPVRHQRRTSTTWKNLVIPRCCNRRERRNSAYDTSRLQLR